MWFRVDDGLHAHRKARRVRRSHSHKDRDVAPFGLWVLAGSWCGAHPTGGFIPLEVIQEWDDEAEELAERLVDAGLWWHDEVDGEDGFRFHDWADKNPLAGEDPGDYGRRGNHIRWHERRGVVDPECDLCSPDDRGESGGDIGANRETNPPIPTRPDPTRPVPSCASTDAEREFERWYLAYPRKRGKGQAAKAYRAARKKADATTLLEAVRRQTPTLMAKGPEFAPYPATWLNGERWLDESDNVRHLPPQTDDQGRLLLPPLPGKSPWSNA